MRSGAALVLALVLTAASAAAQPRDLDARAHQIFTSVMSPYCQGLLLADCPSRAAFELRLDIRARLEAGETPADIEQSLYHRFGDVIRAVPPPSGSGLVLRLVPVVVLLLSLAALMLFLARARAGEQGPPPRPELDRAMEERLNQELEDLS
jgi:cytochrome c-type biogenesis protein CcmH